MCINAKISNHCFMPSSLLFSSALSYMLTFGCKKEKPAAGSNKKNLKSIGVCNGIFVINLPLVCWVGWPKKVGPLPNVLILIQNGVA